MKPESAQFLTAQLHDLCAVLEACMAYLPPDLRATTQDGIDATRAGLAVIARDDLIPGLDDLSDASIPALDYVGDWLENDVVKRLGGYDSD